METDLSIDIESLLSSMLTLVLSSGEDVAHRQVNQRLRNALETPLPSCTAAGSSPEITRLLHFSDTLLYNLSSEIK